MHTHIYVWRERYRERLHEGALVCAEKRESKQGSATKSKREREKQRRR